MRRQFLMIIPLAAVVAACSAQVDSPPAADSANSAGSPGAPERAGTVAQADSTNGEGVHFYNDGWYPAYADVWGYDANWKEIYHDWSGTQYHGGGKWFGVPAGVSKVFWEVRMDPFGNTIHQQFIPGWYNFNEYCGDNKHATIYTGGVPNSTNSYDMHCSYW